MIEIKKNRQKDRYKDKVIKAAVNRCYLLLTL